MAKKVKGQELAYHNDDFLDSDDGRVLRIVSEYMEPKSRIDKLNINDTIVFFGSARILPYDVAKKNYEKLVKDKNKSMHEIKKAKMGLEMSKYYEDAVELSKRLTKWAEENAHKKKFALVTGGGPGVMEATSRGAKLAGGESLGFNITLPHEQKLNPYINLDHSFQFHYFFMRKFWFSILAKALIVFPGGFGTLDELFELLTLSQTHIVKRDLKIIMYDKKHWDEVINFDALLKKGMVSEDEMKLIDFCSSVDEVYDKLTSYLEEKYLR